MGPRRERILRCWNRTGPDELPVVHRAGMNTLSFFSLQTLYIAATLVIFILVAYGMAYWVRRAAGDRSALIGLYLVLGFPGRCWTLLGLARLVGGQSSGFSWLGAGLGLLLPLFPAFRRFFARFTPMDPESAIDMVGLSIVLAFIGFVFQYALNPGAGRHRRHFHRLFVESVRLHDRACLRARGRGAMALAQRCR